MRRLAVCRSTEESQVHELERVLWECNFFSVACERHMMVQYCCDSGSTNKLFCKCFLL